MPTTPISKIRTPDGVLHDFSTTHTIYIPENSEYNVTWNITNFTGSTTVIDQAAGDYQLNINETRT